MKMALGRSRSLVSGVLLAFVVSSSPAQTKSEQPALPTGSTVAEQRTAKITLMALGDNRLDDFQQLEHSFDLMIASHSVGTDVIDAFRTRNPGALVFCYFNTSDLNSKWIKDPHYGRLFRDTDSHEDWFHHDADGNRVRIYYPKYKDRCAFNTGNPALQQYLADRVVETLRTNQYDGIQLDNVSTEFPFREKLIGNWISAVPVELTPEQWTANEVALLKTIMRAVAQAGFGEKAIIFNHMRSGEPRESRAYLDVVDGANCESWLSRRTDVEGRWGWKAKINQVREANRMGKLTNLLCRPETESEEEALFCFASYLMALEGEHSYFFCATSYKMSNQKDWYPFYDVDLGIPLAEYEARDGAFWRPFSRGAVVVNPGRSPVTVSLPRALVTLSGQTTKRTLVGPKQAVILVSP